MVSAHREEMEPHVFVVQAAMSVAAIAGAVLVLMFAPDGVCLRFCC